MPVCIKNSISRNGGMMVCLVLPDQDILTALYGERVKILERMVYNLSDRTLLAHNAGILDVFYHEIIQALEKTV